MVLQRVKNEGEALVQRGQQYVPNLTTHYIPNLITLLGLFAGLTAIPLAMEGSYGWATAAIIIAALLEGFDTAAVWFLGVQSRFGAELNALADFACFGIAPGVLLYQWGLRTLPWLGWLPVLIFAGAAALRLARFNVDAGTTGGEPAWTRHFISGVPAPAAAIMVLLPLYIDQGFDLPHTLVPPIFALFVSAYAIVIAALMVSPFPAFSPKFSDSDNTRRLLPVLAVAGLAGAALLAKYPYFALFLASAVYGGSIPLAMLLYKANIDRNRPAPEAPAPAPDLEPVPAAAPAPEHALAAVSEGTPPPENAGEKDGGGKGGHFPDGH